PSCSKDDADDVKPDVNVPDPNVPDPNVNDNGPKPPTPVFANVDGTLVSIMMSYTVENELLPMPMIMESELGVVAFMNGSTSNFFDAGTVKLNGYALEKAENHGYQVYATAGLTPSSLDIANGSSMWEVSGSSDVTGFTYNHQTPFPQFTGTLPTSISK